MNRYDIVRVEVSYSSGEFYGIYNHSNSRTVVVTNLTIEEYVEKMKNIPKYGVSNTDIRVLETIQESLNLDEVVNVLKCIMLLDA